MNPYGDGRDDIEDLLSSQAPDISWVADVPPFTFEDLQARADELTAEEQAAVDDDMRRIELGHGALELAGGYIAIGDLSTAEHYLTMATNYGMAGVKILLGQIDELRAELPSYERNDDGSANADLYSSSFQWARNIVDDAKSEAAMIVDTALLTMKRVISQAQERANEIVAAAKAEVARVPNLDSVTYNPVLEVSELARLRVTAPIRSPRVGTALVLERATGERMVVASGERVPELRFGRYHRSYLIDLGRYDLKLHERLPSRDPSFSFLATITFACQVLDPVAVIASGVTDMTAAVRASLTRTLRMVASRHDVLSVADAETALNTALDRFTGNDMIGLDSFVVELGTGHTSAIPEVRRSARLDEMRREELAEVLRGRNALIAQLLPKNNGDPSALVAHEAEIKTRELAHYLDAARVVTASGEKIEGFDAKRHRDEILRHFRGPISEEQPESDKRLSRRSRVLGRKPDEAPSLGEPSPTSADDGERRSSRVRGTSQDEPPHREPKPDGA